MFERKGEKRWIDVTQSNSLGFFRRDNPKLSRKLPVEDLPMMVPWLVRFARGADGVERGREQAIRRVPLLSAE